MELTKQQTERLIELASYGAPALKAAFKPRSEWIIEDYKVWLQIAEDLLKQEREKLQKLEAFVEQITCNHCGK